MVGAMRVAKATTSETTDMLTSKVWQKTPPSGFSDFFSTCDNNGDGCSETKCLVLWEW